MTNSDESRNPHSNWLENLINSDELKQLISLNLRRLRLNNPIDEIKNEIFLLIQNLVDSKKLDGEIIEDNLVLSKVYPDGTQEPIKSRKAWLRKVIWNSLLRLRKRENQGNQVILFDEYPDQIISQLDYAETTELREKLTQLNTLECRILELFYFEGLSFREIAICLQAEGFSNYTDVALRQKKHHAIDKLRLIY